MNFEVYCKHGKNWMFLGIYSAKNSKAACQQAGYVHSKKILKARPEYSRDKFFVYRFPHVPKSAL